jgi:hypothetical protein
MNINSKLKERARKNRAEEKKLAKAEKRRKKREQAEATK